MDTMIVEIKRILIKHSYIELDIIKWHAQNITKNIEAFLKPVLTHDILL